MAVVINSVANCPVRDKILVKRGLNRQCSVPSGTLHSPTNILSLTGQTMRRQM